MKIAVDKFITILFWLLAIFVVINIFFVFITSSHLLTPSIINLFNFDREANLPSIFSVLLLLAISATFLVNRNFAEKTYKNGFLFLAIIFGYLAFDEGSQIHESIMDVIRIFYNGSGVFYFVWVIPAIVFIIVLFLLLYKFFTLLPKSFKKQFLGGVAIYLTGAIIMEMIGGQYVDVYGDQNIYYPLIIVVEESLEILGTIIMLRAGLYHIKENIPQITIELK